MVGAWHMLAEASTTAPNPGGEFRLLWATLPLVIALVLAACVIGLAKRWRRRAGPDALSTSDQLAQFRSLYERGELSAEEFARIRAKLGQRLKQELEAAPPPVPPESPTPGASDASTQIQEGRPNLPTPPPEQGR